MSDLPVLNTEEQRVLGSILEKEVTVPASYPMTVGAIRTACNQTSSREPVVDYDERQVHDVLRELKQRELVAVTWADSGRRTLKYVQTVAARQEWAPEERALLTVLLLRGAQPPGALKTRTERLHGFADRAAVEATLQRMAATDPPLVAEQPKRPREQDHRWVHLLGPVEQPVAPTVPDAVDRDSVLAGGAESRDAKVRTAYGTVAESYADALVDELSHMPFERWLLDTVATLPGPAVEVGCGPGHVTHYLAQAGVDATGIDLAPEMVEQARAHHPDGDYQVGDLRRLMRPPGSDGWGVVLAWYSLIHLAASELPAAVDALLRPMRPGGLLLLALHAGDEVTHGSEWFGHQIDLDFVLHDRGAIVDLVTRAGLVDVEWYHRSPIASRDETTERLYVLARKPHV